MSLQELNDFFQRGEFEEVIKKLPQLSENDYIDGQFLNTEILYIKGDIEGINKIVEDLTPRIHSLKDKYYEIYLSIIELEPFSKIFENSEFDQRRDEIAYFFSSLSENQIKDVQWSKLFINYQLKYKTQRMNKQEEIYSELEKANIISKELNIPYYSGLCLLRIGLHFSKNFNLSKALDYLDRSKKIFESLNNKYWLSFLYVFIGAISTNKGDYGEAESIIQKSVSISKSINFKSGISLAYLHLAGLYNSQGELQKSIEYDLKSLEIAESMNYLERLATLYNNMGIKYRKLGELDKAFNYFNKTKAMKMGDPLYLKGISDFQIGDTYFEKGELDKAHYHLQQAYIFFKNKEGPFSILSIERLINISLLQGNEKHARTLLEELKEKISDYEGIIGQGAYKLSKARILLASKRLRDKMKAEDILRELYDNREKNHQYYSSTAMYLLCEVLLDELRLYSEQVVLEEVKQLIEDIYTYAQKQHSYSQLISALILKSKFAILEGKFDQVPQILNQALLTAKEKKLDGLEKKIILEEESFNNQLEQWKGLITDNASHFERIEKMKLKKYIQ